MEQVIFTSEPSKLEYYQPVYYTLNWVQEMWLTLIFVQILRLITQMLP